MHRISTLPNATRRLHTSARCLAAKSTGGEGLDNLLNDLLGRTGSNQTRNNVPVKRSWAPSPPKTNNQQNDQPRTVPSFSSRNSGRPAGGNDRQDGPSRQRTPRHDQGDREPRQQRSFGLSQPPRGPRQPRQTQQASPSADKSRGPRRNVESPARFDSPPSRKLPSLAESASTIDVGPTLSEDVTGLEGDDDIPSISRKNSALGKHGNLRRSPAEGRGSLRSQPTDNNAFAHKKKHPQPPAQQSSIPHSREHFKKKGKRVVEAKVEREVFIPSSVRVGDLARIVDTKLPLLLRKMQRLGMPAEQCRSDYLLSSEDASLVAMEYNLTPIVDEEKSFDIYPDPPPSPEEMANLPSRPPVVTIMGHVDHGKTTLLDALRHTSVAAGEAGGITQHIGAFSVSVADLMPSADANSSALSSPSITFLDTPGHAAFTAMRARGAHVTDIVVLVVAADDGVMPQTKEVIELVKTEGEHIGLVVAINKCDKPGIDIHKVKNALMVEGVYLEEDGGDVPSVEVSGLKGIGLDSLVETLATVAEVRDLRASRENKAEGFVLESRVEKGRGNVATILVTRGTLKTGDSIVAGLTWCRVRQMTDDKGKVVKEALPGMPVIVTGWKEVPLAGDEILQARNGEEEAKKAISNRQREAEKKALMADVEKINEKRRLERERLEHEEAIAEAAKASGEDPVAAAALAHREAEATEKEHAFKELRLVIRADVSGTVEAVVGALEHIGNKEAGVKIVHAGVGDVADSDVAIAEAAEGMIIGFSVKASKSVQTLAAKANVPVHLESVIYRLIETVRSKVAALLPPIIETRVLGEATVLQMFSIAVKGRDSASIAGCRVANGVINRHDNIRVLRGEGREVVFQGTLDSLKHVKKDIAEARKGSECGLSVHGFKDIQEGDIIVAYQKVEKPREL
ncbi:hypothetical protein QFC22_003775 [Naganishia vaughanmartiniae]|uniref:Uncharacterized protein n=1 Tax=Naganishia vaughanmartiniae TaxID=1424756 RepID=A0ACC2X3D4_9TREE|nr:hypothetical protein QFC22_003775 [Naganishia vaughanmartiniae]